MEPTQHQDEQLSSTVSGNGNGTGGGTGGAAANGSLGPLSNYECDRDKKDLLPTTLWNSVTGKLSHKTGSSSSVTTPDGNLFSLHLLSFVSLSIQSLCIGLTPIPSHNISVCFQIRKYLKCSATWLMFGLDSLQERN